MSKAFVDTTILTDVLLKPGEKREAAQKTLRQFEVTELPVYAIKEFKAGPLTHYVYIHNKLDQTGSFRRTIDAIQKLNYYQQRKASTALEALSAAMDSFGGRTLPELEERYGDKASHDRVTCDLHRLALRTLIVKAWKRRRSVTSRVVVPLKCYFEVEPKMKRGKIELTNKSCHVDPECCLADMLRSRPNALKKLLQATEDLETKESRLTAKALRKVQKSRVVISDQDCRDIGDAIFAFFAPDDAVILTTNIKDHKPLAEALNKIAETPDSILGRSTP